MKLHDIEDAEGFVKACLKRSRLKLSPQDYEEMVAEGLLILCDMADRFVIRMPGHHKDGCFSGYAAKYLPNKMSDAWHRLHPEHLLKTMPDGKRRYEYGTPPASWGGDGDDSERIRTCGDFALPS